MSREKKKPWSDRWTILEELSGGGQAATFLAQNKQSEQLGALKVLRRQDDPERRRRMHREVTILKTLRHPGITKLLESNSDAFESNAILYLITEYIQGISLAEKIQQHTLTLTEATNLLLSLLAVLKYTHQNGIVHRDIKPDNIILRSNDIQDPILIDFGLSFNRNDDEETTLTHSLQQLGNRFLALPELQLKSSLQRDPRSDLTQCIGIMFYVLTGLHPVTLTDESYQLPHQRSNSQECWNDIPLPTRQRLLRIFDRGFTLSIDQRWQSADELEAALKSILSTQQAAEPIDSLNLSEIGNLLSKSQDFSRRQQIQQHIDAIVSKIRNTGSTVAKQLGDAFTSVQSGMGTDWQRLTFGEKLGIRHKFVDAIDFFPLFEGQITGNEIVVFSTSSGDYEEFLRFPISGQPDMQQFEQRLIAFYKREVSKLIQRMT